MSKTKKGLLSWLSLIGWIGRLMLSTMTGSSTGEEKNSDAGAFGRESKSQLQDQSSSQQHPSSLRNSEAISQRSSRAINLKNFSLNEFDSPDEPGSGSNMKPSALEMLDEARDRSGLPFRITSGFRTEQHNQEVGGVKDSAHTRGYAADIDISDFSTAAKVNVLLSLYSVGFRRIGVDWDSFVHADCDPLKADPAFWDYSDSEHKA